MKYRTAIIGPKDTVSLFKATGADVFPATHSDEALVILKHLRKKTITTDSEEKYAVIMIIEDLLTGIHEDELARFTETPLPALLALPGRLGSSGVSKARLQKLAERAIGTTIGD